MSEEQQRSDGHRVPDVLEEAGHAMDPRKAANSDLFICGMRDGIPRNALLDPEEADRPVPTRVPTPTPKHNELEVSGVDRVVPEQDLTNRRKVSDHLPDRFNAGSARRWI